MAPADNCVIAYIDVCGAAHTARPEAREGGVIAVVDVGLCRALNLEPSIVEITETDIVTFREPNRGSIDACHIVVAEFFDYVDAHVVAPIRIPGSAGAGERMRFAHELNYTHETKVHKMFFTGI